MKMYPKTICRMVSVLFCAAFPLSRQAAVAQDIDPTVEVTRQYEGRLAEVHKPVQQMPVPDSLQHFDLEFEYNIYDSPYGGTYSFDPLVLDMTPGAADSGRRKFFLKAGAGAPLQPVLDAVWSPGLDGNFRMSLYGTHRSYFGPYRGIDILSGSGRKTRYSGHEMVSSAGADGILKWDGGALSFDIGYYGLGARDTVLARNFDALDVRAGVRSDNSEGRKFHYSASLHYRFGEDKADFRGGQAERGWLREHLFNFSAAMGPSLTRHSRALLGVDFNMADYGPGFKSYAGDISVTPRYILEKGRWDLDLGVRLAFHFYNGASADISLFDMAPTQLVYPDISISFEAVRNCLDLYFKAGGGDEVMPLSGILGRNSRFDEFRMLQPALGNIVSRVSADIGLRGSIASRFGYDLRAGYSGYANAFYDGIALTESGSPAYVPVFGPSRLFRLELDCEWESQDFSVDGSVSWKESDASRRNAGAFGPAALSGSLNMVYNWNRRIFVGIDCGFSTARRGTVLHAGGTGPLNVRIPGYADLGLSAEFKFTRQLSFWVHGGNLLDMTIQEVPLHAAPGINFTAGICLNL